jgi:7 transmembrane sweet-taste receptor of 3 GCPR
MPSGAPTNVHSDVPSVSAAPSSQPSSTPSMSPSVLPSKVPSVEPSSAPSELPSHIASGYPTVSSAPSVGPSSSPSVEPSTLPSGLPSSVPSTAPSEAPSNVHSSGPSVSAVPSSGPSATPSQQPSEVPSVIPSSLPSSVPITVSPSILPVALPCLPCTRVFVNEIHYDNKRGRIGVGFEIAGPVGENLSNWTMFYIDGITGSLSISVTLVGTIPAPQSVNGIGFLFFSAAFTKTNQAGLALVDNLGELMQFISWGGAFTADAGNGAASNRTSIDIGATETPKPEPGLSMQATGNGRCYEDFLIWKGPVSNSTYGTVNSNQTIAPIRVRELQVASRLFEPEGLLPTARGKVQSINHAGTSQSRRGLQSSALQPAKGSLLAGILDIEFQGASGRIIFGSEIGNERNSQYVLVGVYNIHPGQVNAQDGKRSMIVSLVSLYHEDIGWKDIAGTRTVFRDGSTVAPELVRKFLEENFISSAVKASGLFVMFIAWIIGATGLVCLQIYGKDDIIVQAQPFFMRMLCVGSIIMSTSIFSLSWDEGAGWVQNQLDIACTLTPWFFFLVHTLKFCSLFSKLWKPDDVPHFRKNMVIWNKKFVPSYGLMLLTLAVLVSWTSLDPWIWKREIIREIPAETYGKCSSTNLWAYLGPLMVLIFSAETATLLFAWKTADRPQDFPDSTTIMYASFTQVQSWSIGVPMLAVLGNSSADAIYFARVVLIWIFSASSVIVVVAPKIANAVLLRRNPENSHHRNGRVSITGLTLSLPGRASKNSDHVKECASETFGQADWTSFHRYSFDGR